ncbi:arginase family protein [Sorangium sp. So ce693]|uniref:arginase family protein n=1 Tax=Sorangium sp. So ce693 TaxID=3133318 RepID=UPI003F5F830D
MTPQEELALLLRPAAGGLYLVSTGRAQQLEVQRRLYGAATEEEVFARFRASLDRIAGARAVLLGVPSDVGAGFLRGSNMGPQAIRTALLDAFPDFPERAREVGLVDIGDVFVVPQLLHDDMLSEAQKAASRRALYPGVPEPAASRLPVSPLSIAERALDLVFSINPGVAPIVLGGDHSTALPAARALARARKRPWGIVQPDAHTDLLEERLGIAYCFATWSYHANELVGRGGRLTQVGVRASQKPREHWESRYGVRQFWAAECRADPAAALDAIVAHVKSTGVEDVYFSNDIDGTDAAYADATGTPEPDGLSPEFVVALIRRLGREVGLIGGDVMEVAPALQPTPESAARTVALAVRYLRETIEATVGRALA